MILIPQFVIILRWYLNLVESQCKIQLNNWWLFIKLKTENHWFVNWIPNEKPHNKAFILIYLLNQCFKLEKLLNNFEIILLIIFIRYLFCSFLSFWFRMPKWELKLFGNWKKKSSYLNHEVFKEKSWKEQTFLFKFKISHLFETWTF